VSGDIAGGDDDGRGNVSGVTIVRDRIVVCADEGTCIQELRVDDRGYAVQPPLELPTTNAAVKELDLEALTSGPDFLYAIGSHSITRKSVRNRDGSGDRESYNDNRERLATVMQGGKDQRNGLFRVPIDATGKLRIEKTDVVDLRPIFEDDPFLRRAASMPGKENGIDVEGLALDGDWLVLGLRGPVLRRNFAPIVRAKINAAFTRVDAHRVSFVDLGGLGVRDLVRCGTGFLILAGAVGDAPLPFRLCHWDGEDMLPGKRKSGDDSARAGRLTLLGTVPSPPGAKAEGLALRAETDSDYTLLVVYDGAADGAPAEFNVRKVPGL
jgi:hypothetical protein